MHLRPKYSKQVSLPVNIGQATEAAADPMERARRGGRRGGDVRVVSRGIPVQVSHADSALKSAHLSRKYMSARCVSAAGDETRKWAKEQGNDFAHRKSSTTASSSSSSSSSSLPLSSLSTTATQVGLRLRAIADALDRMYDEVYFVSEWTEV